MNTKAPNQNHVTQAESTPPWLAKKATMLDQLIGLGLFLLLMLLITGGIMVGFFAWMDSLLVEPISNYKAEFVIAVLMTGIGILGMIRVWPRIAPSMAGNWSVPPVDPKAAGSPFHVRFLAPIFSSTKLWGKGTCTFREKRLLLNGTVASWASMILVFVVVTVLPLLLFGCGLGFIPALLLAAFIGRRRQEYSIPYEDVQLKIDGRVVDVYTRSGFPVDHLKFMVTSSDMERLYREVYRYLPDAVAEWKRFLEETSG